MQSRHRGAVVAATGLAALVFVLVATPDGQAWVLGAWVLVLGGVAAVAFGVALGFRHQERLERAHVEPRYLTADWVGGAQLFTLDGRSRQAEELGDPVVSTGEVPTIDGDGLASEEGRVA